MTIAEQQFYNDIHKLANKTINWEERRYEIAKEVIPAIEATTAQEMAQRAVMIADALIIELKKTA